MPANTLSHFGRFVMWALFALILVFTFFLVRHSIAAVDTIKTGEREQIEQQFNELDAGSSLTKNSQFMADAGINPQP